MAVCVSEPAAVNDVERKRRHISAPDESHSDSESTSLQTRRQLTSTTQLLPRPRSSVSLIDLIDSSSRTSNVEHLVSDVR